MADMSDTENRSHQKCSLCFTGYLIHVVIIRTNRLLWKEYGYRGIINYKFMSFLGRNDNLACLN
jgi:hypothetical protein